MNLDDVDLLKLLPNFMQKDGTDIALSKAVSAIMQRAFYNVKSLRVWDQFETLNDKQCDELAWELDVDWYDSTMDLDTKRQTLKYAMDIKRKRGTIWSVESLITSYFGDGFVIEYPDFDGQPYTFMVLTTNDNIDDDTLVRFKKAVDAAKNERSRLVGVLYFWDQENEAAEIVSYDDAYHRYEIKRCGLIPHATTVGILNKETVNASSSDTDDFYAYRLVPIDDKESCGTLGGHRGTLGQINKNTVLSSYDDKTDNYNFKKSGLNKCSDTIGSLSRSGIAGAYDDNDLTYTLKRVKNRTILKNVTSNAKVATFLAVQVFDYKRCGLHRCRS